MCEYGVVQFTIIKDRMELICSLIISPFNLNINFREFIIIIEQVGILYYGVC
jgi:hypothetical protein